MDKDLDFTIKRYLDSIKKIYPDIETAYLFGSHVKGTSTANSDIDLALVFTRFEANSRFDMQIQLMLIASEIDSRIEPHPFLHDEFNSDFPFPVEIKKTGIEIAA